MKLGKAFSDNLYQTNSNDHKLIKKTSSAWWLGTGRFLLFFSLFFLTFFLLFIRLFHLTIVEGHDYRRLADENRTRELTRHAPRGIIYDRMGKVIADNKPRYRLHRACEKEDNNKINVSCIESISYEEGERLVSVGMPAGTYLETDWERDYKMGEVLSHVIGYLGEASDEELSDEYYILRKYLPGDKVGRSGAEAVFEETLRGRDGRELVEILSDGSVERVLGIDPESKGDDLYLSIDSQIQKSVYDHFPKEIKGAVIVSKPQTGEILAMYSSPTFDPNAFNEFMTKNNYEAFLEDVDRPLFNRAIGGAYPPGSTFKIITALAALEEGVITPSETIEDTGVIEIGPFSFANWFFTKYGRTDGMVDMIKGIQRSNDIYFYRVGERLGITKLANWAQDLGIGKPLGIELPGEASGLMPDPKWKESVFVSQKDREMRNHLWYQGDTYHVAIGQGYLLTTPLQVNYWTNVIAGRGKGCIPTIQKIGSEVHPQTCTDYNISSKTLDTVEEGLIKACLLGGTGWPLFEFAIDKVKSKNNDDKSATNSAEITEKIRIPVACKTGTSEFGDEQDRTHAWFTVYAPVAKELLDKTDFEGVNAKHVITGDPEISVTVLLEEAGEGSYEAAPIAGKILSDYFSR